MEYGGRAFTSLCLPRACALGRQGERFFSVRISETRLYTCALKHVHVQKRWRAGYPDLLSENRKKKNTMMRVLTQKEKKLRGCPTTGRTSDFVFSEIRYGDSG